MMKKKVLRIMVMVSMVSMVGVCWGWQEAAKERMNVAAEDAKTKAGKIKQVVGEAMEDAKNFWSDSDFDNIPEVVGRKYENARESAKDMIDKAEAAASRTRDTINSAVSDASNYAAKKVREGANAGYQVASDGVDNANQKLNMAKDVASDQVNNARETMARTMSYGKDKVGDAYGEAWQKMSIDSDDAYDAKDKIANVVEYGRDKAADTYDQAVEKFEMASNEASGKADDAKETMSGAMQYIRDKAANAYEKGSQKMKTAVNYGSDVASNAYDEAKDMAAGSMRYGRDKASSAYDEPKNKVGETYASAEGTMNEDAKAKYEAAKEEASQAVGDLGAKMRGSTGEL